MAQTAAHASFDDAIATNGDDFDVFANSDFGVVAAAPNGVIIKANAVAARLVGAHSAAELIACRMNIFDWRTEFSDRRAFARLLESNDPEQILTSSIRTIAGGRIEIDACACRTTGSRVVCVFQPTPADADRRATLTAELARIKVELERKNMVRAEFLANLSHELRTPLNGVIGGADIILSRETDPVSRQFADVIRHSGVRLLDLLNELLELSRVETGHLAAIIDSVRIDDIAHELESHHRPTAERKGLEFRFIQSPDLPIAIETDGKQLRHILSILVDNAVKFTDQGTIVIDARIEGDGDQRMIAFTICDTGCGISDEHIDRIFLPFEQIDSSTTRKFGGAGVGLTLATRLAHLIGANLSAVSVFGRGSAFVLRLPLNDSIQTPCENADDGRAQRSATIEPSGSSTAASGPEFGAASSPGDAMVTSADNLDVLVADDIEMNAMVVSALLKRLGLRPTVAHNGAQALERIREKPFRAVLMDVSMPEMDGVSATVAIRGLTGDRARTPIIALTANTIDGDRERYIEAGMNGYLSKPVTFSALKAALERAAGPIGLSAHGR